MKRSNLRIIKIEEGEESRAQRDRNIFNKIIEKKKKNFTSLKKEIAINIQEIYRLPNKLD
jgi:hypothetical protein